MLPSFLPPLYVVFSYLNITSFLGLEYEGLLSVVALNSFISVGLITVVLSRVLKSKLGSILDLCLIEGASKIKTVVQVLVPYFKSELFYVFLFLFGLYICFTSNPWKSKPRLTWDGIGELTRTL